MRDLILTLLIPAGLVYAMLSARGSILVLLWMGFQRPYDFSWGMWRDLPLWQIAFIIALFSNLLRGQLRPKFPSMMVLYIIFFVWMTLTCLTAYLPSRSWTFFDTYVVPLTLGLALMSAAINDLGLLRQAMWVAAGGIGINGVKTGVSLSLTGGAATSGQISGFVGDNNVFALTLCLVVAVLMGLRNTIPRRWWLQVPFYTGLFFILITIIFTKSRGGLLSISLIMLTASLLGKNRIRNTAVLAAVALFTWWVVPPDYFGRMKTLENVSADASAMGRVENWSLAWKGAVDNPILGVGLGNHIPYHQAQYSTNVIVRVAHSVYFQVLGELSFIGLLLFIAMSVGTYFTMWRNWWRFRRIAAQEPEYAWLRDLNFWLFCGFTGYLFGAAFLNMLFIEFPWYVMLFSALMYPLYVKSRQTAGETLPASRPGAARIPTPAGRRDARREVRGMSRHPHRDMSL